jgi:hypothetical protein
MSDLGYGIKKYVRFTADEFIQLIETAAVIALVFSVRPLLFTNFGELDGILQAAILFVFTLAVLLVVVWLCKIVAVRVGHFITYRAHVLGLILGAVLTVLSQGFFPVFLPGGFRFDQTERSRAGKWLGHFRGWEIGLIAGTFPLALIAAVLVISPLYLLTLDQTYLMLLLVCTVTAVYACIPVPLFDGKPGREWFRSMRGSSFGLDVAWSSIPWYFILCVTIAVFGIMSYSLTLLEIRAGLWLYAVSLMFGVVAFFVYTRFFKSKK